MVFSNNEQTATTEAADVVFLNGNFRNVVDVLRISSQAVLIAKQAIWFGIGLSTVGMIAASL
jgi:cation transport ATPase